MENVLTVEVFQALDFLPRAEFLGRIIRSAQGGSPAAVKILAEQVEDLTFSLLPGDIDLAEDPPKGKGRLHLQPDGVLQSPLVYCMLEVKRIKRGAFMPEQLAREFLAVVQEARGRHGLLLLVLPSPPPVHVRDHGRLALHDAVELCLPRVLERADGQFPGIDELRSIIDSTVAYTTWPRIEQEVERALSTLSSEDPSVRRSINRLGNAVINAIRRHGPHATPDVESCDAASPTHLTPLVTTVPLEAAEDGEDDESSEQAAIADAYALEGVMSSFGYSIEEACAFLGLNAKNASRYTEILNAPLIDRRPPGYLTSKS